MAAIDTRTEIVAHQDDSLCPLSAQQRPEAERDRVLAPVCSGVLEPSEIRVPHADGALAETADPVAMGFEYTVTRSALDQAGQPQAWQERRLVVRSLAFAASQEQSLRQRVARAVTELHALDERTQGTARIPDEAGAYPAAAAIMAKHRVDGLGHVTVTTEGHTHVKRRDGTRPATTGRSERVRVRATCAEAPLAHAVRRLGWRGYATNHAAEEMRRAQGVAA